MAMKTKVIVLQLQYLNHCSKKFRVQHTAWSYFKNYYYDLGSSSLEQVIHKDSASTLTKGSKPTLFQAIYN